MAETTVEESSKPSFSEALRSATWLGRGIFALACAFLLITVALIASVGFMVASYEWENLKPAKEKEADEIQYFVETFVISPIPPSLRLTKLLYANVVLIGDGNGFAAGFTTDAQTADRILKAHAWKQDDSTDDATFRSIWPDDAVKIEHYRYDVPHETYKVWMSVSTDRTKVLLTVSDIMY